LSFVVEIVPRSRLQRTNSQMKLFEGFIDSANGLLLIVISPRFTQKENNDDRKKKNCKA